MLGEAWVATQGLSRELAALRDERAMFRLWGEEQLHPFVYEKRLKRYDDEIGRIEEELAEWSDWYDGLIEDECCGWDVPDPRDPFEEVFDELCRIDGVVSPRSFWDEP